MEYYLSTRFYAWSISINNKACESFTGWGLGIQICSRQHIIPTILNLLILSCHSDFISSNIVSIKTYSALNRNFETSKNMFNLFKSVFLPISYSSVRYPHFLSVDNIFITLFFSFCLYTTDVRPSTRFCHCVCLK